MPTIHPYWALFTRLGEGQIVLPVLLLSMGWLVFRRADLGLVAKWLGCLALAIAITLFTKVAFMGFGMGVARLNFTGISGHSMVSAAVYPMLAGLLTAARPLAWRRAALLAAAALALLIGISRVMVGAHSSSEVIAGLALGGAASAVAMAWVRRPSVRLPVWLPVLLALWFGITPTHAPASTTHGAIIRFALAISGRAAPYTRDDMLREWQDQQRPERAPA